MTKVFVIRHHADRDGESGNRTHPRELFESVRELVNTDSPDSLARMITANLRDESQGLLRDDTGESMGRNRRGFDVEHRSWNSTAAYVADAIIPSVRGQ